MFTPTYSDTVSFDFLIMNHAFFYYFYLTFLKNIKIECLYYYGISLKLQVH